MRKVMTVQLSEAAADALDSMHRETRLQKKVILEQCLVWVARQSPTLRAAVLGTLPSDLPEGVLRDMVASIGVRFGAGVPAVPPAAEAAQARAAESGPAGLHAARPARPARRREGGAA